MDDRGDENNNSTGGWQYFLRLLTRFLELSTRELERQSLRHEEDSLHYEQYPGEEIEVWLYSEFFQFEWS